jgi:hypothetical protein
MVRAGIKEAHPAGIYSDMTSDGPVIGTLVVVLDRAVSTTFRTLLGKHQIADFHSEKSTKQKEDRKTGPLRRRPVSKGSKAYRYRRSGRTSAAVVSNL